MILKNALLEEDVPAKGATKGHVRFAVLSSTPSDIALVGFCANVTASLLFERLQAQGTNIVINLEKDKSRVDVLARYENDGLNIVWTPKTLEAQQLADVQERIRNKTFLIGKQEAKPVAQAMATVPESVEAREPMSEAEEDYLVKQLHRIP